MSAIPLFEPASLLQAIGVLLGFQLTVFSWRIVRELKIRDEAKTNTLVEVGITPSDWLSISAIVANVVAILALTVAGSFSTAIALFSGGLVLFATYPFAVIGHYGMYTRRRRPRNWQPASTDAEWITIIIGALLAASVFVVVVGSSCGCHGC